MAVLMLAVFTVSLGYGVVLPLLPDLIERLLGAGGNAAQISRSTGLLTGLYTLSIFFFAPVWGHLSDRYGRRRILLIGLVGFSVTMLTFATIENLVSVYSERLLSGVFAAAVTPVSLAAIGDLATTETARARRLTFVSLAGISGFLLGPMFGVLISHGIPGILPAVGVTRALSVPLAMTGGLAVIVAIGVALTVPGHVQDRPISQRPQTTPGVSVWLVPKLLALAFIVSAGVGVFEVGLALRGKQELGLTQYQIALMFTECSLAMIVVQALVFSPLVKPETTRWFIAPALGFMAAGLFLVPRASDFVLMLVVIGAVAASAGILSPILTYWISMKAGKAQGTELGKQTAAASLGGAVGSAVGGIFFDVPWLAGGSFLLAAALTVLGVLLGLGLPSVLVRRKVGEYDDNAEPRVSDTNSQQGQGAGPLAGQPIACTGSHHITVIHQSEPGKTSMSRSRTKHSRAARIFVLLGSRKFFLSSRESNNISTYEELAKAKWLDGLNQYQRRSDLLPNLVETVTGFTRQESTVLEAVTAARGWRSDHAMALAIL